jgi:hypothetical protein
MVVSSLEPLLGVDLQYQAGMQPVILTKGRVGQYLGSEDGIVSGSNIQETIRWDLFEKQGDSLCEVNLIGIIETQDGASLQFDSLGFFLRPPSSTPLWKLSAALKLETSDEAYHWVNHQLAMWEGELDLNTYYYRYQAYLISSITNIMP